VEEGKEGGFLLRVTRGERKEEGKMGRGGGGKKGRSARNKRGRKKKGGAPICVRAEKGKEPQKKGGKNRMPFLDRKEKKGNIFFPGDSKGGKKRKNNKKKGEEEN